MRIKESSKKTLYLVLGLLLLSICSLTIVYAALSAVLRISGNSEVVASNWEIHLENPEVKGGSVHNNLPTIDDNKLSLGKCSVQEAKSMGIRDAVTFGPFLIVNGKSSAVLGNGGWGSAPRTAIGQRKDGIVLFLVIDGRKATKFGADMDDMIRIMENYGAYNAANLDGGTSSVLVVDDVIVNDPIDSTGAHKTRPIATGFILKADDADNGDKSVVEDKLNK